MNGVWREMVQGCVTECEGCRGCRMERVCGECRAAQMGEGEWVWSWRSVFWKEKERGQEGDKGGVCVCSVFIECLRGVYSFFFFL